MITPGFLLAKGPGCVALSPSKRSLVMVEGVTAIVIPQQPVGFLTSTAASDPKRTLG
jgi:hypothetical protein